MPRGWRRAALVAVLLLFAGSSVAACSGALAGGAAGAIGSLVAAVALLVGTGATQAGCDDDRVGPCLSKTLKYDVCLSADPGSPFAWDVGPCLVDIQYPMGVDVGPCLKDIQSPMDVHVGPCLEDVAPQLDPGPPPADVPPTEARSRADVRRDLVARGMLPADVAARLTRKS